MLNNQHSQPLRCHTNESPDMPGRFTASSTVFLTVPAVASSRCVRSARGLCVTGVWVTNSE